MAFRYLVLGAGRQGSAGAHDLALRGDASLVTLADIDIARAREQAARVAALVPGVRVEAAAVDATDEDAVAALCEGHDAALSAMSYSLNETVTRGAIRGRCHVNDLGGNTGVVRAQLAMDAAARDAGVSVVPDCGLAPGLGQLLVAYGLERFPGATAARVRCGGLPQRPQGPLDYMMVFSAEGLTNEYMGEAEILQDGQFARVPTFEGLEQLELPSPVGPAEAFFTSGGISTLPERLQGRLRSLDYKTVRYPGHCEKLRVLKYMGFLDLDPVEVDGATVVPRHLTNRLFEHSLRFEGERDLIVMRVEVEGPSPDGSEDESRIFRMDLVDFENEETGFTAMERGTAYPAAMVTKRQAMGVVKPGAHHSDQAFPLADYAADLPKHEMDLVESWL